MWRELEVLRRSNVFFWYILFAVSRKFLIFRDAWVPQIFWTASLAPIYWEATLLIDTFPPNLQVLVGTVDGLE